VDSVGDFSCQGGHCVLMGLLPGCIVDMLGEKLAVESVIHLLRSANLTAFLPAAGARCLSRAPVMIARLWSSRSCCVHELVTLITTVVPPKLFISL
jgi:hypothetical protein